MNLVQPTEARAVASVEIADDPASLDVIHETGCDAVIWQRQTPPEVQAWIDHLDPGLLPKGRVIVRPGAVRDVVEHYCMQARTPAGPERAWLVQDIDTMARTVSGHFAADFLRLRLDVVTHNACRKFHKDAVPARLVCTYRGTGSQYGISESGEDPKRIFTVPTGAPILLRGTPSPEWPASGLLHRSPPIEGTGETRFVLVIDPVDEPD
ncbi:MAG: DUF1826 domain-containing protein [Pseudomonadota bacterium]